MRTCAPFLQSSIEQYSAGLCETPLRQGTKIIDVGTTLLQNTLSLDVYLRVSIAFLRGYIGPWNMSTEQTLSRHVSGSRSGPKEEVWTLKIRTAQRH